MKIDKNHIKVLSVLSIAASDTREDTLKSIIIRTLFVKSEIALKSISSSIKEEFDFEPYDAELVPLMQFLIDEGKVNVADGKAKLTVEEIELIKKQDTKVTDEDKERFQNFKNFITEKLDEQLDITRIKFLWLVFLEYLYDSFYEYGFDALKTLHPYIQNGENGNGPFNDILHKALSRIREKDENLCEIFKKIVEQFPDFASEKDIEFISDLAQKTLSFTSLGIKPELAFETLNHKLIDWVLYLDTNVLYSLLNLHSHPENQSCLALIKLIQSNKDYIQINLRYSELTYRELGSKKADFSLLDEKMTDSAIRALLKSENLDDFSRKFYQDLLEKRDSTLHPSKVIELAQQTLKRDIIEIGRNAKRLENLGEEYIEKCMDDYASFVSNKNKIKEEFCLIKNIPFHPYYRSDRQIRHDVSLREILIDSRNIKNGQDLSLNNIKFFAITLDDLLIAYDRSKIRDYYDEKSFPVFFKPSFLLNKLIKVLPIKTVDYKKAFIKAITTKGYNKNPKRSEDVLKIVNYLKSKGIDDEKVIYNIITEDLFLEKFREHFGDKDFNSGEFIESELNREFKQRQTELDEIRKELELSKTITDETENEKTSLSKKVSVLESDLNQYKKALETLSGKIKILVTRNPKEKQIDIEFGNDSKNEAPSENNGKQTNSIYKIELRHSVSEQIESIRERYLKSWQNKVWWNLFWVIPLITLGCFLVIPNEVFSIETTKSDGDKSNLWSIIIGLIAFLCNGFFLKILYQRYFNEREKKARKENAKIPQQLQQKLEELNR
jgi:hypothetical protein